MSRLYFISIHYRRFAKVFVYEHHVPYKMSHNKRLTAAVAVFVFVYLFGLLNVSLKRLTLVKQRMGWVGSSYNAVGYVCMSPFAGYCRALCVWLP